MFRLKEVNLERVPNHIYNVTDTGMYPKEHAMRPAKHLAPWVVAGLALCACTPDTGTFYWDGIAQDTWASDTSGTDTSVYDTSGYELPDMAHVDNDGDGWTPSTGDCNDAEYAVNPGAYDDPENGVDDNCDGVMDSPIRDCDCGALPTLAEGMDLCDPAFILGANTNSYASAAGTGRGVRADYGTIGNALTPRYGCKFSMVGTGPIEPSIAGCATRQPGTDFYNPGGGGLFGCTSTEPDPDPTPPSDGALICDTNQIMLQLKAPTNAAGFSFDFLYMSAEYPEWVGEGFNDTFYAILDRPTAGEHLNISFDDFGAEIEVDNAFFEDPPTTNINGTGYTDFYIGEICGSSTGWLRTAWEIDPGEVFNLTFSIHDEGDGIYDSMVIIDNFQWSIEPVDPGTVII